MSKGKRKSFPGALIIVRQKLRLGTLTNEDRQTLHQVSRLDLIALIEGELGVWLTGSQKNSVAAMVTWLLGPEDDGSGAARCATLNTVVLAQFHQGLRSLSSCCLQYLTSVRRAMVGQYSQSLPASAKQHAAPSAAIRHVEYLCGRIVLQLSRTVYIYTGSFPGLLWVWGRLRPRLT